MRTRSSTSGRKHQRLKVTVVTQMGGLGDLVLTSPLIAALRRKDEDRPVVLVCRRNVAGIAELFPSPPSQVIPLDCDPPKWTAPNEQFRAALDRVKDEMAGLHADTIISAEYRTHWFAEVLAGMTGASNAFSIAPGPSRDPLLAEAQSYYGLPEVHWDGPVIDAGTHMLDRLTSLAACAGADTAGLGIWTLPDAARNSAVGFLQRDGIPWKGYTIVFPFGAPEGVHKRWPLENFAAVLNHLRSLHGSPLVLLGTEAEREGLESLRELVGGDEPVAIFAGTHADLATVCGLVAGARMYLGNDTGPMHLAGAYGVPGVAIYGGGHWPVYKPWAAGSIGVVEELPCFSCDWDCVLGHGLCVEAIPIAAVKDAIEALHAGAIPATPEVRVTHAVSPEVLPVLADASRRFREVQKDRTERYRSIVELHRITGAQRHTIEYLDRTAAERLQALEAETNAYEEVAADSERRRRDVDELTRQIKLRDVRITELEAESADRLRAVDVESKALGDLRKEADVRSTRLREAAAVLAAKDELISSLQTTAEARLALVVKADADLKRALAEAERRAADVQTLTGIVTARDEAIAHLTRTSEERLASLMALKTAMDRLAAEAEERKRGLEQLTAVIERQKSDLAAAGTVAAERLAALEQNAAALEALRKEADKRADGLNELARAVRLRDDRIAELERTSQERLGALLKTSEALEQLREEANKRADGLMLLTEAVAARDATIARLEQTAAERLTALLSTTKALDLLRIEADKRAEGLKQLTGTLQVKDEQLQDAQQRADERLAALEATAAAADELRRESAKQNSELVGATEALHARDARIAELESVVAQRASAPVPASGATEGGELNRLAEERLEALTSAQRTIAQWETEAARRLEAMRELTEIISARDARIEQLEKTAQERLDRLVAANEEMKAMQQAMTEASERHHDYDKRSSMAQKEIEQLNRTILRLKREIEILEAQIVALEDQNLYNFLIRRWGGSRRRPPARSQN